MVAALASACTQAVPSPVSAVLAAPTTKATETLPRITVHRDAYCGCCHLWVEHLREEGFEVDDRVEDDMGLVKQRLGIAPAHASCHTAEVGGYVVEGHVPASDILPGMPMGSPGMEVEGVEAEAYTVLKLDHDGTTSTYAQHQP
ncbi:MAG: metal-binding protein [Stenotrophomonas acidaminiphila]|nr:MAG: metal-binding protein [Stenotrophomonas acidaminiphila]